MRCSDKTQKGDVGSENGDVGSVTTYGKRGRRFRDNLCEKGDVGSVTTYVKVYDHLAPVCDGVVAAFVKVVVA